MSGKQVLSKNSGSTMHTMLVKDVKNWRSISEAFLHSGCSVIQAFLWQVLRCLPFSTHIRCEVDSVNVLLRVANRCF